MRGAIPPLPNTSSWRGAQLSTGTTLPLPILGDPHYKLWDEFNFGVCRSVTNLNYI